MPNGYTKYRTQLTRAINSKDPAKVLKACKDAVNGWEKLGGWPDNWSNWQRALDDYTTMGITLEEIS